MVRYQPMNANNAARQIMPNHHSAFFRLFICMLLSFYSRIFSHHRTRGVYFGLGVPVCNRSVKHIVIKSQMLGFPSNNNSSMPFLPLLAPRYASEPGSVIGLPLGVLRLYLPISRAQVTPSIVASHPVDMVNLVSRERTGHVEECPLVAVFFDPENTKSHVPVPLWGSKPSFVGWHSEAFGFGGKGSGFWVILNGVAKVLVRELFQLPISNGIPVIGNT